MSNGIKEVTGQSLTKWNRGHKRKVISSALTNIHWQVGQPSTKRSHWLSVPDQHSRSDSHGPTWGSGRVYQADRDTSRGELASHPGIKQRPSSAWLPPQAMHRPQHSTQTQSPRCTWISAPVTHSIHNFVTPPWQVNGRARGMGGNKVAVTAVSTIRWSFNDNNGMTHSCLIPGSLYIPSSPARLFSPQHRAQEGKDNYRPQKNGTWQATYADHVELVWGQRVYRRQIPFDKSNVATFTTSAGCKNFRLFRECLDAIDDDKVRQSSTPTSSSMTNSWHQQRWWINRAEPSGRRKPGDRFSKCKQRRQDSNNNNRKFLKWSWRCQSWRATPSPFVEVVSTHACSATDTFYSISLLDIWFAPALFPFSKQSPSAGGWSLLVNGYPGSLRSRLSKNEILNL